MRPRLLDLFCGAGGAAVGYYRAGWDVVGVDIAPQPNYPFRFVRADALDFLSDHGREYSATHASPPCQRYSTMTADPSRHPDLIAPVRQLLIDTGGPWVIENVPQAPLIDPVILCGSSFALGVRRHRAFESSVPISERPCRHADQGTPVGVYGQHPDRRQHYRPNGQQRGVKARTLYEGRRAYGHRLDDLARTGRVRPARIHRAHRPGAARPRRRAGRRMTMTVGDLTARHLGRRIRLDGLHQPGLDWDAPRVSVEARLVGISQAWGPGLRLHLRPANLAWVLVSLDTPITLLEEP